MIHGLLRVAAATPKLSLANCRANVLAMLAQLKEAQTAGVAIVVFPELALTGYTCGDLFHQVALQRSARESIAELTRATASVYEGVAIVGLPLVVDDQLFNCAAVLHRGRVQGVVPKSYLPNYKEFYEKRWFSMAATARSREVELAGGSVPFGTHLLFQLGGSQGPILGVEICEDVWVPIPPSCKQALNGATLLVNLSASNEVIGKSAYRRQMVANQSGRCIAAYVYTSCGVHESTTDLVFGGHCLIAENGSIVAESQRFQRDSCLLMADIDVERLRVERIRTGSFSDSRVVAEESGAFEIVSLPGSILTPRLPLRREIEAHPFVPRGADQLRERCEEIFHTQVSGLARRLEHIRKPPVSIGISGGLDSTLALLVACKTFDALSVPRSAIRAITMPGYGTTDRTKGNARALMDQLEVRAEEVDIRLLCLEQMRSLGHAPFGIELRGLDVEEFTRRLSAVPANRRQDLVFENVQARMRTSILMNAGFVIGTGDLSESALGWCTYNGDHMSMYNPNASIPKTLVKFLVDWAANNEFDGEARKTLADIVNTEISPELLPTAGAAGVTQSTEGVIGPYELHDFYLYHFVRYGAEPEKIVFLAGQAKFSCEYAEAEVRRWLKVFLQRFFQNQFKRSCLPDGPKVGTVSFSPRGDWRMPSDPQAALWLEWAEAETS